MDNLNAQQIVLLTLLVSFVTSIATGITTVSLLEQAPEPVTQTINRVVERTVERVVEVNNEDGKEPQEKIIETIVVKEEDLTIDAVDKNSKSLVRIFRKNGDLENFVGLGVIVSDNGNILSSSNIIEQNSDYIAKYAESKVFPIKISSKNEKYALLAIDSEQQEEVGIFQKVRTGNSQNLKLGQTVIALSGQNSNSVSVGIITSLETLQKTLDDTEVNSNTVPQDIISLINTSVNPDKIVSGALLLNLQGELVGFKRDLVNQTSFESVSDMISFLESIEPKTE
jgi:hypothetical protein